MLTLTKNKLKKIFYFKTYLYTIFFARKALKHFCKQNYFTQSMLLRILRK